MIRSPLKAGDLMMRARMACISENISSSVFQAPLPMPYPSSALGVEPPYWSRAAMKPLPDEIFCACAVFMWGSSFFGADHSQSPPRLQQRRPHCRSAFRIMRFSTSFEPL